MLAYLPEEGNRLLSHRMTISNIGPNHLGEGFLDALKVENAIYKLISIHENTSKQTNCSRLVTNTETEYLFCLCVVAIRYRILFLSQLSPSHVIIFILAMAQKGKENVVSGTTSFMILCRSHCRDFIVL